MKEYVCEGDGCTRTIPRGERYLDKALREPAHAHLRYCCKCGEAVMEYESIRRRNDFSGRYQERIASADWKTLRSEILSDRGNRCERCKRKTKSLALHHKHYKSLGRELPEDLMLLCVDCHKSADEERDQTNRPKHRASTEGWIVGRDGDEWGTLKEDQFYVPLDGGRYLPVNFKKRD